MTADEMIAPAEGNNEQNQVGKAPQDVQAPAAPSVIPPSLQTEQNDFKKILEEVKLPERRDFKAAADAKTPAPEPEATIMEERIVKAATPGQTPPPSMNASTAEVEPVNTAERSSAIVAPVRTLKDDLQTIVREQKISLVHAATLEEEKRQGQEHLAPEQEEIRTRRSHRTMSILFAVAILVLLGAAAIFGVVYVMQEQQALPPAPQQSILFAEQTVTFSLDGQSAQSLKASLAAARTKQLGNLGSITRIVPTILASSSGATAQETPATIAQFFTALGMQPPQELVNAIGPDFFFGFHVVDTNAPVLVIPVTSYDHAFAGMLAWEPTMDADLAPVFAAVSMTTTNSSGVPVERTFQDAVMRNYDVRELTDDSGNIVLYYSFPTPNILVIAESPYSFTEILSRLQAAREL